MQESVHIIDAQTVSRGSAMLMMNQDAALQLTVKFQALGRAELDADNLLKVAFALHMKRSQVEDLRKQYR